MKISIVVPSNRTGNDAIGRIFEWSALDPDRFEVIIRDNSCDPRKRDLLSRMGPSAAKFIQAEHCDPYENFRAACSLASGDFVLFCADDDRLFPDGLYKIHATLGQISPDRLASHDFFAFGSYFMEDKRGSKVFSYPRMQARDKNGQIRWFIDSYVINFLFYSICSKRLISEVFSFKERLPAVFSFSDQIFVILYFIIGHPIRVETVFHGYSMAEWDSPEKAMAKTRRFLEGSGLDPALFLIHDLMRGLEGFKLLRSDYALSKTGTDNRENADKWLLRCYSNFAKQELSTDIDNATARACRDLRRDCLADDRVSAKKVFERIYEIMAISNPAVAARYSDFWESL